jgi:hypothetical protein
MEGSLVIGKKLKTIFAFNLMVIMLMIGPSLADIYKCVSDDGVVTFSDEPCGQNAEVAFEKYIIRVDDAIGLDIIGPFTNRAYMQSIRPDIESHAKKIGSCILPRANPTLLFVDRAGGRHYNKDINWKISLFYGPQDYEREWNINVYYKGKKEKEISLWLNAITITKDGRPFTPSTMHHVKKLKRIGTGEWEIRHQ